MLASLSSWVQLGHARASWGAYAGSIGLTWAPWLARATISRASLHLARVQDITGWPERLRSKRFARFGLRAPPWPQRPGRTALAAPPWWHRPGRIALAALPWPHRPGHIALAAPPWPHHPGRTALAAPPWAGAFWLARLGKPTTRLAKKISISISTQRASLMLQRSANSCLTCLESSIYIYI